MKEQFRIEVKEIIGGLSKQEVSLKFDYYDIHNYYLGNVLVNSNGRLTWSVWNDTYEEDILKLASIINGFPVKDTVQIKMGCLSKNNIRWQNALNIIDKNSIKVSCCHDDTVNEEKIYFAK